MTITNNCFLKAMLLYLKHENGRGSFKIKIETIAKDRKLHRYNTFLLSTYGTETLAHAQSLLLIKKPPISLVFPIDGWYEQGNWHNS